MKLSLLFFLLVLFKSVAQEPIDSAAYRLFNDPVRSEKGIHREIGKIELVTLKPHCETFYRRSGEEPKNRESLAVRCHPQSILTSTECDSACGIDTSLIDCRAELTDEERRLLLQSLIIVPHPNRIHTYCYEPRNGIVLYDVNGEFVAYIELCFQCGNQLLLVNDSMSFLYDLTGKKVLKQLFLNHELLYGIGYQ